MFKSIEENKKKIQGAYRKLKSYYYYNNNFLVMRKKIADFEWDEKKMDDTFNELSFALCHPIKSKDYINALISQIDFYVIPKKFESSQLKKDSIISNTISRDKKMKTVNFFINAPIELHILDTLFTLFLGKMNYDKDFISFDVYGNTLNNTSLYNNSEINYENRILFNRYFDRYTKWRNNAFESLDELYKSKKDSVLISLDIKSYFYSVSFCFDDLYVYFEDDLLLDKIRNLTSIIEKMYGFYYEKIKVYRKDLTSKKKKKYPLPIGLFSSMVIGNLYLAKFDNSVKNIPNIVYYGRYVDDILIVVNRSIDNSETTISILNDIFVNNNILNKTTTFYDIVGYDGLQIQGDKVKLLYINHEESRAIIDIYNDTIKIIPSQMNPLPTDDIDLSKFDEAVYNVENFTKEKKIRDIGLMGIDTFKVGKYFSNLPRRYSQINYKIIKNEINDTIMQIKNFFTGSQCIEFYSNWLNYFYFLVITENKQAISKFCSDSKKAINNLKSTSLDTSTFSKVTSINRKVKEYLQTHLNICYYVAFCLNFSLFPKSTTSKITNLEKFIKSNMFNHNFVTFPLSNYLDYKNKVSFCKMMINEIGDYPKKIEESFKFIWSPRFIHYHELLLLLFYYKHNKKKDFFVGENGMNEVIEKLEKINHLDFNTFKIYNTSEDKYENYLIKKTELPYERNGNIPNVFVAIGSLNISLKKCIDACYSRESNITFEDKKIFFNILRDTYDFLKNKKDTMFLVLPELCFPIYWINDLINFSKATNIGIITGIQYIKGDNNRQINYVGTILPFFSGKKKYKNVFLNIREKNDYSPIEFEELTKIGFCCENKKIAEYQIFNWNGIRLTPIVCYELTDIMARALLKGKTEFIAVPVFNPDTTYFSNIIDSSVRDLHAFIIQSNTSFYGDSRITGPYDRDNKDIFKIKGGDNDHVVIGTIDYKKYKIYQCNYESNFELRLKLIEENRKKKNPKFPTKKREKPDIKPFSARFKIK